MSGSILFAPSAMSANSRYLLTRSQAAGSNVFGVGVLGGRGAIQSSFFKVSTDLRGLDFLGMLKTPDKKSTHPKWLRISVS